MTDRPGNLVLTRGEGQAVYVDVGGVRVVVHVVAINGRKVELMFTAPRSVVIERDDLKSRPGDAK